MTLKCVFVLMVSVMACLLSMEISTATGQSPTPGDPAHSAETPNQFAPAPARPAPYRMTGRFHLQRASNTGYLVLECELPKGSYIYSLTQPDTLRPSVIKVTPSEAFATSGQFLPDRPPKVIPNDPVFNQRVEKHLDKVQFFIQMQLHSNVDPETLQPELIFDGQVCSSEGVCRPIRNLSVKAKFAGYYDRTAEKPVSPENPKRQ